MDNTLVTILVSVIVPIAVATIPSVVALRQMKLQLKANEKKLEQEREINQKEFLEKMLSAIQQQNETEDEALRCLLRTHILNLYFKHKGMNNKTLTQWESENLHKLYEAYTNLNGNSFAEDLFNKMNQWEVVQN